MYITKDENETRSEALYRERDELRKSLKRLQDFITYLRTTSEEEAIEALQFLRSSAAGPSMIEDGTFGPTMSQQ